jgi:hypothetical protein
MADGLNIDGVDWDLRAFLQNEQLSDEIKKLFISVIKDAAALAAIIKDPKANFKFSDYPAIRTKVKKLFRQFAKNQQIYVNKATQSLWELANKKNDALIESIADKWDKPLKQFSGYGDANTQALRAFQQRVENGLGLSDRIWNNTQQAQAEIEALISKQLQAGAPAVNTARLIRDFTLANGGDFLSPGRGVYKSSLKNAQRLIRTENNMAYRAADFERWQTMDFVVGVEVRLSNNPNHCPMCAALVGKYPKDFKFLGWHPNCRCYAVPILMNESDFDKLEQMQLAGEDTDEFVNGKQYKDIPEGFRAWVGRNKEKPQFGSLYFVRDNPKYIKQASNQLSKEIADLMAKAKESKEEVEVFASALANKYGGYTTGIVLKSKESILRKAVTELNGGVSLIKDSIRTTVILPESGIRNVFAELKKIGIFDRLKLQSPDVYSGYSGILGNIRTKTNIFAEIQLNTEKMIYAKELQADAVRIIGKKRWDEIRSETGLEGGLGHKYYEEMRVLDKSNPKEYEQWLILNKESKEYYKAFQWM